MTASSPVRLSPRRVERRTPPNAGRRWIAAAPLVWLPLLTTASGGPCATAAGVSQTVPSIRFAIELAQDAVGPIYVLVTRTDAQPGWVQVTRDGAPVHLRERCDIPDCGLPAAVCGMAIAEIRDLAATEARSIELTWDLTTSVNDPISGCERRERVQPGAFVVRFCYAFRTEPGGASAFPGMPGGRLIDPICSDRSFTLEDRAVTLTVPPR